MRTTVDSSRFRKQLPFKCQETPCLAKKTLYQYYRTAKSAYFASKHTVL
jgi:hypothetical protein